MARRVNDGEQIIVGIAAASGAVAVCLLAWTVSEDVGQP
jgi:hypothetical protein